MQTIDLVPHLPTRLKSALYYHRIDDVELGTILVRSNAMDDWDVKVLVDANEVIPGDRDQMYQTYANRALAHLE